MAAAAALKEASAAMALRLVADMAVAAQATPLIVACRRRVGHQNRVRPKA